MGKWNSSTSQKYNMYLVVGTKLCKTGKWLIFITASDHTHTHTLKINYIISHTRHISIDTFRQIKLKTDGVNLNFKPKYTRWRINLQPICVPIYNLRLILILFHLKSWNAFRVQGPLIGAGKDTNEHFRLRDAPVMQLRS